MRKLFFILLTIMSISAYAQLQSPIQVLDLGTLNQGGSMQTSMYQISINNSVQRVIIDSYDFNAPLRQQPQQFVPSYQLPQLSQPIKVEVVIKKPLDLNRKLPKFN